MQGILYSPPFTGSRAGTTGRRNKFLTHSFRKADSNPPAIERATGSKLARSPPSNRRGVTGLNADSLGIVRGKEDGLFRSIFPRQIDNIDSTTFIGKGWHLSSPPSKATVIFLRCIAGKAKGRTLSFAMAVVARSDPVQDWSRQPNLMLNQMFMILPPSIWVSAIHNTG